MLSTDSFPRKWSMRKTCDSSNAACTVALRAWAEARSVPKGFSMMTRARSARPVRPEEADHRAERHRWDGEVMEPAGLPPDLRLGLGDRGEQWCGVVVIGGRERQEAGELLPRLSRGLHPAELADGVTGVGPELRVRHGVRRGS